MRSRQIIPVLGLGWLALASLTGTGLRAQAPSTSARAGVTVTALALTDESRQRSVPVTVYTDPSRPRPRLAILSHGYGGKNTAYSFLATHLAERGYYVASVQHELPGDEPLPTVGKPYEVRMTSWQQGVRNILFVLESLKKTRPDLDFGHLLLVGHSHGGDTSMLFAREHPGLARAVISLDNRRMPFPRAEQPRILSLRSSDQRADDGVLPTVEEQARYGMRVVNLPATIHNDMWDGATPEQQAEMLRYVDGFLDGLE